MDSTATQNELQEQEARRSKVFLRRMVFLIFIINGAILLKVLVPEQPTYQGKTVTQWLRGVERFIKPEVVNAFGPEVWPELVKAAKRRDSKFSNRYASLWRRLPLRVRGALDRWRPIPAREINEAAYGWLAQLGRDAQSGVPDLIALVRQEKNPDFRASAIRALGNAGLESPEALSAFFELLQEPESIAWRKDIREEAIIFMALNFGRSSKPAVPLLIESVRTRKHPPPILEIIALSLIGPEARDAVPVFVEALKDPVLRTNALQALAAMGPGAEEAVPAVIEVLRESRRNVKAVEILFRVGPPAKAALPLLREIESRETNVLRVLAAMAISRIETNPQRALPSVIEALQDEGPGLDPSWMFEIPASRNSRHISLPFTPFVTATWFLGELGSAPENVILKLKEVLATKSFWMRIFAAHALGRLQVIETDVINALAEGIDNNNYNKEMDDTGFQIALPLLEKLGPRARAASPALVQFITNKTNWWVQRRAVWNVLEKIDRNAAAKVSLR